MAFLDKTGLVRLWEHINSKIENKVEKEADKGLILTSEAERLSTVITGLEITDDVENLEGVNIIQNAHTLGGIAADQYALKSEIIGLPFLNRIMVSLPSSGWIQEASGRYTQNVVVGDITSHSKCHHVDIDMSGATEENINDIRQAWSLIDIVEATDDGVLFTAFSEAPAIDLSVYIDIEVIKATIPKANGVIF